jgi:hypothetical protein
MQRGETWSGAKGALLFVLRMIGVEESLSTQPTFGSWWNEPGVVVCEEGAARNARCVCTRLTSNFRRR